MPEPVIAGVSRSAVFRLEAGGSTGWGHLARSGALAQALANKGWVCQLWTASALEGVPPDLAAGFVGRVPVEGDWLDKPPPSVCAADWLVVDHHDLSDTELHRLKRAVAAGRGPRLLVFDDEASRTLVAADLALNSRPGLGASPYASGVPVLLGERYALLRPGLLAPAEVPSPFPGSIEPVLVMLGGTDPLNLTAQVVEALADVDPRRFAPVLIRTRSPLQEACIQAALERFSGSVWLESVDARTLAGWARHCRYALSAAGGTLHELALFRLPFVGVVVADNQRAFAQQVRRTWGMPVVEGDGSVRVSVARAFRDLVDHPRRDAWSTVDGFGPQRVASAMETAG